MKLANIYWKGNWISFPPLNQRFLTRNFLHITSRKALHVPKLVYSKIRDEIVGTCCVEDDKLGTMFFIIMTTRERTREYKQTRGETNPKNKIFVILVTYIACETYEILTKTLVSIFISTFLQILHVCFWLTVFILLYLHSKSRDY